jgi:hypothetical protein
LLSEHTFVATSGEALDAAGSFIAGVVIAAIAKYAAASSRNGVLFVEPPDFFSFEQTIVAAAKSIVKFSEVLVSQAD